GGGGTRAVVVHLPGARSDGARPRARPRPEQLLPVGRPGAPPRRGAVCGEPAGGPVRLVVGLAAGPLRARLALALLGGGRAEEGKNARRHSEVPIPRDIRGTCGKWGGRHTHPEGTRKCGGSCYLCVYSFVCPGAPSEEAPAPLPFARLPLVGPPRRPSSATVASASQSWSERTPGEVRKAASPVPAGVPIGPRPRCSPRRSWSGTASTSTGRGRGSSGCARTEARCPPRRPWSGERSDFHRPGPWIEWLRSHRAARTGRPAGTPGGSQRAGRRVRLADCDRHPVGSHVGGGVFNTQSVAQNIRPPRVKSRCSASPACWVTTVRGDSGGRDALCDLSHWRSSATGCVWHRRSFALEDYGTGARHEKSLALCALGVLGELRLLRTRFAFIHA
ncbi:unnamed protein product, partial [Prorocentrum cordatum]